MKLDQLTYFLEAARLEHIGKASKTLAISASAVSHSIAALEEELGRELFVKQGKRVVLTNHGKLLAERARNLLNETAKIREELVSDQVELRGHYRLAGTHLFSEQFLVPAWLRVLKAHPMLSAETYSLRSAEVLRRASEGEIDFGICLGPQPNPDVNIETLFTGHLRVVVRDGHPLASKKPGDQLRQVSSYPAAAARGFQGIESCDAHPFFREKDIKPKIQFYYDSYMVALAAIQNTDYWTMIPDFVIPHCKPALRVLFPKISVGDVRLAAIWPKNRVMTRTIGLLKEELERGIGSA